MVPCVKLALKNKSSLGRTAVSLAGWLFVKEWLLRRCDGFTFQIWSHGLIHLPPPPAHSHVPSLVLALFYPPLYMPILSSQCFPRMHALSICVHSKCDCEYEKRKRQKVSGYVCMLDHSVGPLCMKPETRLSRGEVILECRLRY